MPVNVFIPGTDISVNVNLAARYALLDSLPQGIMASVCYTVPSHPAGYSTLAENVVVLPGVSTLAGKSGWNFSRILFLNTTASGAGTTGNVYSFPVLVRLTKGNFNFNEAKTDGSDIRFVTSGNMRLSYEIEQWDASQGSAAIWVKVDTVLGNNGTQYITMQWGNPDGQNTSNSASVFDTSSGFQGVWHMNETGAGFATDATPNHYDGTPSTPPPLGAPGLIGACRKFNGTSNFIMMNGTANSRLNFPVNGSYTVSAWVNLDSIPGVYKVFISKGAVQYTLQINNRNNFEISEFHDGLGFEYSQAPGTAKAWKYVVGVREGTNQHLYIDGILATNAIIVDSSASQRFTGDQLIIGAASSGTRDFLNGMMDELSISSVSRGSDWIKLCYMNQRVDDKLVLYK
jgi:biopolymer transport protein ExbB